MQPRLRPYRLPLWQRVREAGGDEYRLSVWGPLDEVRPLDAEQASYLIDTPCRWRTVFGRRIGSWPDMRQLIRQHQPEVVVFCATPSISSCWTLPAEVRRNGGVPLAWTKVHSQSGRRRWWSDWMKQQFFRRFELVIGYGRQSLDELASLDYPAHRARLAQNTLDTDGCFQQRDSIAARAAQLRAEHGLTGERLIVSIGRMIARKRHLDLIRAWPEIRAIDPLLRLVLIGSGPMLDDVRRQAAEADAERILVTGAVPWGDDYAWLAAADLVVLPGALGLAVNQSLALGRPTIVADEWGADAEILEHEATGWRFPRGDLAALATLIRRVLGDEAERRRITEAAQSRMRGEVTLDRLVGQLDAAFRDGLALRAGHVDRPGA